MKISMGLSPDWKEHFDRWTFVHNSRQGIGPDVLQKLLALQEANPQIKVTHWGYEELRKKAFSLQDQDIAALLGPSPTRKDLIKLNFEDLRIVLVGSGNRYRLSIAKSVRFRRASFRQMLFRQMSKYF